MHPELTQPSARLDLSDDSLYEALTLVAVLAGLAIGLLLAAALGVR